MDGLNHRCGDMGYQGMVPVSGKDKPGAVVMAAVAGPVAMVVVMVPAAGAALIGPAMDDPAVGTLEQEADEGLAGVRAMVHIDASHRHEICQQKRESAEPYCRIMFHPKCKYIKFLLLLPNNINIRYTIMKGFWKTVLAVVVGIFLVSIISGILWMLMLGAFAALGSAKGAVPSSGVLTMDMSKVIIAEQKESAGTASLMSFYQKGEIPEFIGIWDAIQAIDKAAEDPGIKYLYLRADGASGGMAEIEELRKALCDFRESGKPVIAWTENPSNGSYYLASAADKIYMTSCKGGMNTLTGIGSQLFFLKDILDKLGVNVQLIRHGKYKSAGEMYIKNDISPENRLQYETFIGSIWKGWSTAMAESRGMSPEDFNSLIDGLELNSPEDFLKAGLVDELFSRDQLEKQLCTLYGTDKYSQVKNISLIDYAENKLTPNFKAKDKIAVIYADGEIIDGRMKQQVAGDRFAALIAKVRADSTVKAVVFRVSSPGGSVMASEKIKAEIDLTRACKPVIASYGNYAASGGYWISANCDKIFTNASTLTGSIGVFSMIPDFSKTVNDIAHVKIVPIGSNKHSDMYSLMRPLDGNELAYMQESVEDIYDAFTTLVSEGRGLEKDFVDEIAQGRVWAGSDAIGIGLVDEIGTIKDAISYAMTAVKPESSASDWQVVSYPKPQTPLEMVMESLLGSSEETVFSGTPLEGVAAAFKDFTAAQAGKAYARLPYHIILK